MEGKTHPDPPAMPGVTVEVARGKTGRDPVRHLMNADWDPSCGFTGSALVTNNRADVNCQECHAFMAREGLK